MFYIPRVTTYALGALLAPAADDGTPDTATGFEPPDDTILAEAVFVGTVLDVWEAGNRWIARFAVECAGLGTRAGEIERLHVRSKAMAPDALAMLDRFGPMQRWTCLDCWPAGSGAAVRQNIIPPPPAFRARIATARRR